MTLTNSENIVKKKNNWKELEKQQLEISIIFLCLLSVNEKKAK